MPVRSNPSIPQRQIEVTLPWKISATLLCERFQGKPQFYAMYEHEGKPRKLVIDPKGQEPVAGEQWVINPRRTPNGHIYFCELHYRERAASGMHVIEEIAPKFVDDGFVRITWSKHSTVAELREGVLEKIQIIDEKLHVHLGKHTHWVHAAVPGLGGESNNVDSDIVSFDLSTILTLQDRSYTYVVVMQSGDDARESISIELVLRDS